MAKILVTGGLGFIGSNLVPVLARENNWQNPFGDGKAGQRIVSIIRGKET